MRGLVWFAVTLAVAVLINAAVFGYFNLHSQDNFLMLDNGEMFPEWYGSAETDTVSADEMFWVPYEWETRGDTIYSNHGNYPSIVPFEPGMTIYPGQTVILDSITILIHRPEFDSLNYLLPVDKTKI
jgi:hypothetical protein